MALAVHKIKHSAHCLNVNKALGFASCFIGILAARLMLYFTYSTHVHALTNTYDIQRFEPSSNLGNKGSEINFQPLFQP